MRATGQAFTSLLLGLAALAALPPALAGQQVLVFDTPAANVAEVQTVYGLSADAGVQRARVVDGELLLYGTGGVNGQLQFAASPGDLSFEFDTRISDLPGYVNVGFTTGNQVFYIHPGYWDRFFIPGLGVDGAMGFTPDHNAMTHFSVDISTGGLVNVVVQNNHQAFITSFTDPGYVAGVSQPGLTVGSVPGYWAFYDNLVITTVPEPQAVALWTLGLAGLLAVQRRRGRPTGY